MENFMVMRCSQGIFGPPRRRRSMAKRPWVFMWHGIKAQEKQEKKEAVIS